MDKMPHTIATDQAMLSKVWKARLKIDSTFFLIFLSFIVFNILYMLYININEASKTIYIGFGVLQLCHKLTTFILYAYIFA